MSLGTLLYTWFFGNFVGSDELSNKYYCNSTNFHDKNSKRWVIFNGKVEASKIPPHWHAWLHKSIELPPLEYKHKYKWQQDHQENKTGSKDAYFPSSHPLSKTYNFDQPKKDYESWTP